MKKAFTLIELVVAVALMAMVIAFSSVIFKVSIGSHRTASANAEIMQKFRAITDQLNRDFEGIQTDAPLLISFEQDAADPDLRYDQIMFFATGDFQSTQLYSNAPVRGNAARIYYGQADVDTPKFGFIDYFDANSLARNQHILTADPDLDFWPNPANIATDFDPNNGGWEDNLFYEHDSMSLSQWKTIDLTAYKDAIIPTRFERLEIDMGDPNTYHNLMCQEIDSFTVQWAYWDDDEVLWFPENPSGFGVFFNIPDISGSTTIDKWAPIGETFPSDFYPKALKFTFTLYDSKGIIENGRKLTHIVYLGD